MIEQQTYTASNGAIPISLNDQHLACVLLLDTSASMQTDDAIGALNTAIRRFKEQCVSDDALCRGLDVAVVSFSTTVTVLQEFTPICEMKVPYLEASGQTAMGAALHTAMKLLEHRKAQYRALGVPYYRPWIFMISDGAPNDEYAEAFRNVNTMQDLKKLELWAVGVPGYDRAVLTSITKRVMEMDEGLNFAGLFEWLSTSLSMKKRSIPTDILRYSALPEGSRVIPSDW